VWCWGDNSDHALGTGNVTPALAPTLMKNATNVTHIAAGNSFTCIRIGSGQVRCAGVNGFGQGGKPDVLSLPVATEVSGLQAVGELSCGNQHCCARAGGVVRCWGRGAAGQLGNKHAFETKPVQVLGL